MDALFKLSVSRRLVVLVAGAVAAMAILVGIFLTSERSMLMRERSGQRTPSGGDGAWHIGSLSGPGDQRHYAGDEAKKQALKPFARCATAAQEYSGSTTCSHAW